MTVWGMDDDRARVESARLARNAERIAEVAARLRAELDACPWTGNDRQRFASQWQAVADPALARVAAAMTEQAHLLAAEAARQAHASR